MSRSPRHARVRGRDRRDTVCAWCEQAIADGYEVLGVGAKAMPSVDLQRHEGRVMRLHLVTADRSVLALAKGADSSAKREGHDLYFMMCGEACAAALRAALAEETRPPCSRGDEACRS
jgi:hypothetical protein